MEDGLIKVLAIGTVFMFIPIVIQSIWRKIPVWKSAIVTILLTITGVAGIYIWFFVENLEWGGRSFFGAVFLVPVMCILAAKLLRISYKTLTDISAPAGCAMLALMKLKCYADDCCRGIRLYRDAEGVMHFFPAQLVEFANALVLLAVLLILSRRNKKEGTVYAWFLTLYGATRFVLNFFRSSAKPYLWILPAGHVWSLVAIGIGIAWMIIVKRKEKTTPAVSDACIEETVYEEIDN